MTKFNINKLEFNSITNEYGYVEFNDIKLYVTKDKQWFCVTRFIREIKKHLESYKKFNGSLGHRCSTRIINRFKEHYPQLFLPYVQGPCKGKVSGQYVSFELF